MTFSISLLFSRMNLSSIKPVWSLFISLGRKGLKRFAMALVANL